MSSRLDVLEVGQHRLQLTLLLGQLLFQLLHDLHLPLRGRAALLTQPVATRQKIRQIRDRKSIKEYLQKNRLYYSPILLFLCVFLSLNKI